MVSTGHRVFQEDVVQMKSQIITADWVAGDTGKMLVLIPLNRLYLSLSDGPRIMNLDSLISRIKM
jgi:hypothetical protein